MLGSASPLWTQAAAEAHVPVTQETGRQAAPIADLRVRVVSSLEEVAPVLAKRQQGCCLPVSLLGVCVRRPRGQSKGASETDAATGSQEGPLFAAFFGNPFLLCAVLTFSGQDQRGCPPPRPVGDKVSASPGSGRMQRAHASLQASVISPARHGRFCSSAAPKPRNLVRKEMVCLTPASNGEDKSDHLLQGDCDIPPCGGVDTDLKRTARWTSTQTRWPLWDQGEPACPHAAPAFSSEGPGPWTGWHSGLGAPHRHWRGLGPVKIHPGSQFSRRRHHEGAPDLIVPV